MTKIRIFKKGTTFKTTNHGLEPTEEFGMFCSNPNETYPVLITRKRIQCIMCIHDSDLLKEIMEKTEKALNRMDENDSSFRKIGYVMSDKMIAPIKITWKFLILKHFLAFTERVNVVK